MFWRKKGDGFEWHKYVRTTIKLRREGRQRRIDGVKDAAVAGIKGAGRAGLEGSAAGLDRVNSVFAAPFVAISRGISGLLNGITRTLDRPLRPVADGLATKGVAPMLGLVAVVSGLLALGRYKAEGLDQVTMILAGVSLVLLAALIIPPLVTGRGVSLFAGWPGKLDALSRRIPGQAVFSRPVLRTVTALGLGGLAIGAGMLGLRAVGQMPNISLPSVAGLTSSRPPVEGRASAVGGDLLRVSSQLVRLSGVDAPEQDQQCGGQGKERRWKCGAAAQTALQEMVRGKTVRCELRSTPEPAGSEVPGSCTIDARDVAAEMVARGHVFAASGLFSSYGRQEQDARNAKLGLWRGTSERPSEYRARLWEVAKKKAPDGCPIKGRVSGTSKSYVVPWQPGYGDVKVQPDRGGRWFCSEDEAQAAGWKPATRSSS